MYTRLLNFLCCPHCQGNLEVFPLTTASDEGSDREITEGLLSCERSHWFPVVRGVPRMLPDALADWMSVPFTGFCKTINKLGLRVYPAMSRREAALALMDIFGAPYAYYHTFAEVSGWYKAAGFTEVWPCNDDRRGFGVCGRLPGATNRQPASDREATAIENEATLQAVTSRQGGQF